MHPVLVGGHVIMANPLGQAALEVRVAATLFAQNKAREAAVPEKVTRRMTERWEVPLLAEAHVVERLVRDAE
jgi:hypothetical protein